MDIKGLEALEIIRQYELTPPVFTNEYYSEFHGQVLYAEYNPKRIDINQFKEKIQEEQELCVNVAKGFFGSDFVEVEE
jgi:hypothetical protein